MEADGGGGDDDLIDLNRDAGLLDQIDQCLCKIDGNQWVSFKLSMVGSANCFDEPPVYIVRIILL